MLGISRIPKGNIVLVEDSRSMATLISELLKPNYNVKKFINVANALEWMKTGKEVELIITDYLLPEINGLEFIEHLKTEVLYREIPTLLITGVKPNHLLQEHETLKSIKIIYKPFDPTKFLNAINELLLIKS